MRDRVVMCDCALRPAHLAAVLSLTMDVKPNGNLFHGWRVALVAHAMASDLPNEHRTAVFWAGLLHDIGCASAPNHITSYPQLFKQICDPRIKAHPELAARLIDETLGFSQISTIIQCHHEWWNGEGYPEGLKGSDIPTEAQLIRIADSADIAGCFNRSGQLEESLQQMRGTAGREWSEEMWAHFVKSLASGVIPKSIMDDEELPGMMSEVLQTLPRLPDISIDDLLERMFILFARVVDSKHTTCKRHSERVAEWALAFGEALQLSPDELRKLRWAACVHDAGRMAVPPVLLGKREKLTRSEFSAIRAHAKLTDSVLRTLGCCRELEEIADIASYHHERYDGNGYPEGLAKEDISLGARILAVADAYEAMTSDRAYREGVPPGIAMKRLVVNSGSQFDPQVVSTIYDYYLKNRRRFENAWGVGALGEIE